MSPRRASPFLSRRRKKGTKERATLLSATPSLRCGATWGARSRGAPQNSLRACGAALKQLRRVSSRSMRAPTRMPPRALRAPGAYRREPGERTPTRAIAALRCARPRLRGRKRHALRKPGRAQRWPVWLFGCWMFGCPPLLAAPAAGRLWGGTRVGARVLRELNRRGCPSGAAQQQSEFHGAPRNRPDAGLPRSEAQGSQTGGRLSLAYFSLAKQRKVSRPPGRQPGLRPQPQHAFQTSTPRLRQAQAERVPKNKELQKQ